MILGVDILHNLVQTQNLVENLCERELTNPEGCGFDLRLGELFELTSPGFLGQETRDTTKAISLAQYDPKTSKNIEILPQKYYLVKTIEKINLPSNITALFRSRTTLFRSGLMLITGNGAPGYSGELIFGLVNLSPYPFKIELGSRIVHIMFYRVEGQANLYRGQWKEGRVTTTGTETQV